MKQTAHAFRQLKSHLDKVSNTKFVKVQDAALKIILQRTVEFGSIKKKNITEYIQKSDCKCILCTFI